ncbi:MAG: LysR family transcriptional regulator [Verrucomicrobiales bacterium]|nr:LysR family transcriptional regulator [Verrucomicrobiales bacterium]
MHIESLQVFCDLANTGTFSEAAARNHITQSAVSQQIRSLEKRLGSQLLERTNHGVDLTPEGRVLLEAARRITEVYSDAAKQIERMRGKIAGTVRVATVYSIGLHELPPHVRRFREKHPEAQVEIRYRKSGQVYQDVSLGTVDIGLVAFPKARRGLAVDVYAVDQLVVICNPSHPFARKKSVRFSDLSGQNFVAFEPDTPTRQALDRLLKAHQVVIRRTMEFDNVETVKRAVEVEDAISIVPRRAVSREVASGTLRILAVGDHSDEARRPLGALRRRSRALTPPVQAFLEELRQGEAALPKAQK